MPDRFPVTRTPTMSRYPVRTPCIGICSTTYGGDVCRGCKRFAHEVIDWNAYSDDQKQRVWARLTRLAEEVVALRLHIVDAALVEQTLRGMGVRFHPDRSPALATLELLRAIGHQQVDLNRCGLVVASAGEQPSPAELYQEMNEELFRRAEAWFDLHHGRAKRLLQRND